MADLGLIRFLAFITLIPQQKKCKKSKCLRDKIGIKNLKHLAMLEMNVRKICWGLLYVHYSQTVRGGTLYTLTGSFVHDDAAALQVVAYNVGTSLRQLVVDLLRTLG